ncbi:hypothetical protein Salmuc_00320 [Salipiger mucosus DSM 16094]|uniref:Uncharacterized protein n=1 Tax=Salipiger mucosus DSM 16094 TaxID=1123237 RepID=S9RR10_9RHOB|nr:hypothetical protein Salmuc_00320 [Salipiger mucosus DSM 16094]
MRIELPVVEAEGRIGVRSPGEALDLTVSAQASKPILKAEDKVA